LDGERKREIAELHQSYKSQIEAKDRKIEELHSEINDMKAQHCSVDRLLAASAAEQEKVRSDWLSAQRSSRTFYGEIKALQSGRESAERALSGLHLSVRSLQASKRQLTASYLSAVNDLKRLQEEMDKTEGVADGELEDKEKKIKGLTSAVNEQRAMYRSLMADHQKVLDLLDELTKERQQLTARYATLMTHGGDSRPVTPRPNWTKAVELKLMSLDAIEGKSTDDIVSVMATTLNQLEDKVEMLQSMVPDDKLKEMEVRDDSMYFDVDFDAETPKYLKYRGTIRKKRMAKRDCERMLSSIWKRKYSTESTAKMDLGDYLFDHLKCEFGIQSRVVETGYSLLNALQRYRYDADCELFATILDGELSEDVYRDQVKFLKALCAELEAADKKRTGTLPRAEIEGIVSKLCPAKNEQNMKKLMNALDLNDPEQRVRYDLLFKEDRDGNQGPFLEELRDQHLAEIDRFHRDIKDALKAAANQFGQVTVQQIERALNDLDRKKPKSELNKYLCAGFGVSMRASLADDLLISVDTFCKKLSAILVKRTGPKQPLSR